MYQPKISEFWVEWKAPQRNSFILGFQKKKKRKLCGCEIFEFKIGTLRSDEAMAAKTPLKKWIYVLSAFIAIIPTHFLYQKYANLPGVELLGSLSKFQKRNKFWSLLVYVLNKKKYRKKCDARAKLLFCLVNLLLFWRRRPRCDRIIGS